MQFNSSSETKVNTFNERNKKMHSSSETKKKHSSSETKNTFIERNKTKNTFIERNKKIHSSSETKNTFIEQNKKILSSTKQKLKKNEHTHAHSLRGRNFWKIMILHLCSLTLLIEG